MKLTAGELRQRIAVCGGRRRLRENGETETVYDEPARHIWAKIVPFSGRTDALDGGGDFFEITHKCYIRAPSLPDIRPDMYFLYRGQRYDILYYTPVYSRPGWMELRCSVRTERGLKKSTESTDFWR